MADIEWEIEEWPAGRNNVGYVQRNPSAPDNEIWVILRHWPAWKKVTAVQYQDDAEAVRVFQSLQKYPFQSSRIGYPLCYNHDVILFEQCSSVTLNNLRDADFPLGKTWDTVRTVISCMLDLHESEIGGMPPDISDFVRTVDNGNGRCKLYYASTTRERAGAQWDAVVQEDYNRMVAFVRQLIRDEPGGKAIELMKSEALFTQFLETLHTYSISTFGVKQRLRPIVLKHPLLLTYEQIRKLLDIDGWLCSKPHSDRVIVREALESIPKDDWQTRVNDDIEPTYGDGFEVHSLHYEHWAYFIEYCRDLLTHPNLYNLGLERMIRDFEVFYPQYLGYLWVALNTHGVCPNL